MSQWVMHRHPTFFDDPLVWKPERWQNDLEKRLPKHVYFPFGGGPHLCIGNTFAMTEVVLLLATLIPRVQYELVAPQPVQPEPSLTLRPKQALTMRLSRRP
jgi:cytochrome P450